MAVSESTTTGARSLSGRRAPLGWLPWAALRCWGCWPSWPSWSFATWPTPGTSRGWTNDRLGGATESGSSGTGGRGTLNAGGRSLLPLSAAGPLGNLGGQAVTGKGAAVESVVADEGFWVGPNANDRVFVSLLPQARGSGGESPFQVRTGPRAGLAGTPRPVPANVGGLGVDEAEGAAQVRYQGQYIEAFSVHLSS